MNVKLQEAKQNSANLEEIVKDLQFTLNGIVNIERRTETYDRLKTNLFELEDHLKSAEIIHQA